MLKSFGEFGSYWEPIAAENRPEVDADWYGFAASGTCLKTIVRLLKTITLATLFTFAI